MNREILFVDDESPIRELLSLFFRKKGYHVTTAVSSQEALGLVNSRAFDLAILDIDLAGENGMELLCRFKSSYPKMPVIMFTGMYCDEAVKQEARKRGADEFMEKTEPLEKLFGAVERVSGMR